MNKILYHANCDDGFGAAYAAWKKFGDTAQYIPVKYGQPPPDDLNTNDTVTIVDFSYPRDVLLALKKKVPDLIVIDHHKTSLETLGDLQGDFVILEMEKSGAVLAWEFWHTEFVPDLLLYVQDRDLWQFRLHMSQEISAALRSYPQTFTVWDTLIESINSLKSEGISILRAQRQQVSNMADRATLQQVVGYDHIPTVNASVYFSDVCDELNRRYPEALFSAYWFDRGDGRIQWGLSTRRDDIDVSAIAKKLGGGGHQKAAGFTTSASLQFFKSWNWQKGNI